MTREFLALIFIWAICSCIGIVCAKTFAMNKEIKETKQELHDLSVAVFGENYKEKIKARNDSSPN
jgi:hypothetical protein